MRDSTRTAPCASSQIVTLALPGCSDRLSCRGLAGWVYRSPAALAEGLIFASAVAAATATGQHHGLWQLHGQACPASPLAGCCGGVSHRCSPSESCMGEGSIAGLCRCVWPVVDRRPWERGSLNCKQDLQVAGIGSRRAVDYLSRLRIHCQQLFLGYFPLSPHQLHQLPSRELSNLYRGLHWRHGLRLLWRWLNCCGLFDRCRGL